MKFLDLNTGYSFDGLWKPDQLSGYVFWLPNEQSVNITYSTTICVLTNSEDPNYDKPLNLTIENNDVFSFIKADNKTVDIDCCTFNEPIYTKTFATEPEDLQNGWYAHVFNVSALSENSGEFVCKLFIGDNGDYIKVGGDFYDVYEPTLINLSNYGVEISDEIQKAIYDSNIHNDNADRILLNRKFKELLSNYWDIIANRGSYKSLVNSLDWFEWDENLKLKRMQKREDGPITVFDDKDIIGTFESRIEAAYTNFVKTAYVSLFYSLYSDSNEYDIEGNPVLVKNAMKWARNDMQLKLALLTQFFGAYFLPIHMSVLYSALEEQIYTNTLKAITANNTTRHDAFGDFTYVESNIKDDEVFKISNVSAFVRKNTSFKYYDKTRPSLRFGVDEFPEIGTVNLEQISNQFYTGPGAIIPINITIPNQCEGDFIKQTIVYLNDERLDFYDRIKVKNGKIEINFNFLATTATIYEMQFVFIFGSSKTITKFIKFTVEDTDNLNINVYKIQAKDYNENVVYNYEKGATVLYDIIEEGFTYDQFNDFSNYKYIFKIQSTGSDNTSNNNCYMQYLPVMMPNNPLYDNYKGIKLNRTVVFDVSNSSDDDIKLLEDIFSTNYLLFKKYRNNVISYITFVSKRFFEELPSEIDITDKNTTYTIIRNDLGFYPQFHDFIKIDGDNESNYVISQYDAVCCAAEINVNKRKTIPFRYGNKIESVEWSFINSTTGEIIEHPGSSRKPFIANSNNRLAPGYYGILFKYNLGGIENECRRESAFRIKII